MKIAVCVAALLAVGSSFSTTLKYKRVDPEELRAELGDDMPQEFNFTQVVDHYSNQGA